MPNPKSPPGTALVIGGGVIGLSTALTLQARGIATTLVDPGDQSRAASWGNAGHIATEQVEPLASRETIRGAPGRLFSRGGALALPARSIGAWLPFALRLLKASRKSRFEAGTAALSAVQAVSLNAWRRLVALADAPDLLREQGHFAVWENPQAAQAGRQSWASANTGTVSYRDATPEELAQIAGLLSRPLAGGLRFTGSAQIADSHMLADALESAFERRGGILRRAAIRGLAIDCGAASATVDDGETLTADAVIVSAGFASAALLRPLGHKVPLIAERGYHIQTPAPGWPADMPPIVFEERSMIVTRFRSGLRAASFVEFSKSGRPPDARKWTRLRDHARALGLPFEDAVSEWMGSRPTFPDYLPAIGRSRRAPNLFYAFGHQHLGLTLAAATAEAMAALVSAEEAPFGLTPFDLDRFGG